jgi:hypothetical protein
MRSAGSSVREVDDEFGLALLRDRLRNPFGGFSSGVVAEFLPNVGAYDPVVEVVVRDNVNSCGCHRLCSEARRLAEDRRRRRDERQFQRH